LATRVSDALGREPLVFGDGPERIGRLAVATGAAGYDLIRAAHEGFDALLTGEPEEPNYATAQELGIHLLAAGHHATERFGVQALAAHLADTFAIEWRYHEIDNPV
jgi:putative NIF3 family GTP cyclohydrolase 1 type 2